MNAMYVTSIRRCEVELIFKIRIQIPVPSYITVKEDLNARIMYEKSSLIFESVHVIFSL